MGGILGAIEGVVGDVVGGVEHAVGDVLGDIAGPLGAGGFVNELMSAVEGATGQGGNSSSGGSGGGIGQIVEDALPLVAAFL